MSSSVFMLHMYENSECVNMNFFLSCVLYKSNHKIIQESKV